MNLINIKNLSLLAHSKANLTNLEIKEALYIKQTATAIFDNTVIIANASAIIKMAAYQNDLIPMIQGSLIDPPKDISILRSTDDGPKYNEEYIIFNGHFNCESWFERLGFSNSLFNTVRCAEYNNTDAVLLDYVSENRGFISFVSPPPIVKNETFMPKSIIAIIIFSIIDASLNIFIIIILIKKYGKKRIVNFSHDASP